MSSLMNRSAGHSGLQRHMISDVHTASGGAWGGATSQSPDTQARNRSILMENSANQSNEARPMAGGAR